VEKLLNAGAHPNTPDDFTDRTPLMNAVIFQHLTVIEKLLANGADPLIKNKFGFTALDYALTPEIKELLQNNK
jgi:ankyrin repeat protein